MNSHEEIEIRTEDSVGLRAIVREPPLESAFRGTCVMAHALFARKSEFGRRENGQASGPVGLAQAYAARGWRTVAFDFRGHGESALPKGEREWRYDELVRLDFPAVVGCARARSGGKPVIVVGHSLGGHVALAAQGSGTIAADAMMVIGSTVWMRAFEPSRSHWAAKVALGRAASEIVSRFGRLPARRMRLGSDDASGAFTRDLLRFMTEGAWRSADGAADYLAGLSRVNIPLCAVASDGDLLTCTPRSAEAFARRVGGPFAMIRIARSDDGRPPPGHMAMVTSARARSKLMDALGWIESALAS